MSTLAAIFVIAGIVAAMIGWAVVARGRDVWRTLPPLFAGLGAGALLLLPSLPAPAAGTGRDLSTWAKLGVGVGSALVLFVATRVFVAIAARFRVFAGSLRAAYGRTEAVAASVAVILSVVAACGEELFWRGLVYRVGVDRGLALGAAALVGLALYVIANVPSRLLPVIVGAAVAGGLWAALAWWTGGILAPIASHMLWTGLMLGFPPSVPPAEVT
jgi:membrane protease YdiL (CAAX protease family)